MVDKLKFTLMCSEIYRTVENLILSEKNFVRSLNFQKRKVKIKVLYNLAMSACNAQDNKVKLMSRVR
jgi:hypothetical protein